MPQLYSPDGTPYRTDNQSEVIRLRGAGYNETKPEERVTFADQQFHPADKKVDEVLTFLAEHPQDAERIIAEEKAGQARVSIIGKADGD